MLRCKNYAKHSFKKILYQISQFSIKGYYTTCVLVDPATS